MTAGILDIIPYEETSIKWDEGSAPLWKKSLRNKLADALNTNIAYEKQVRVIVKEILEHWDDSIE